MHSCKIWITENHTNTTKFSSFKWKNAYSCSRSAFVWFQTNNCHCMRLHTSFLPYENELCSNELWLLEGCLRTPDGNRFYWLKQIEKEKWSKITSNGNILNSLTKKRSFLWLYDLFGRFASDENVSCCDFTYPGGFFSLYLDKSYFHKL